MLDCDSVVFTGPWALNQEFCQDIDHHDIPSGPYGMPERKIESTDASKGESARGRVLLFITIG